MSEQHAPHTSEQTDDPTVDDMIERVRRWLFGALPEEPPPDRDGRIGAGN